MYIIFYIIRNKKVRSIIKQDGQTKNKSAVPPAFRTECGNSFAVTGIPVRGLSPRLLQSEVLNRSTQVIPASTLSVACGDGLAVFFIAFEY